MSEVVRRHEGPCRTVCTWTKILSTNIRCFVAVLILRFVRIYALFGGLGKIKCFLGTTTVFLGYTWVLRTCLIEKKNTHNFFKPNCPKLRSISKNVSLKIGSRLPQKLSQIFKNGEKLHYKIRRSKGPKYP